jgi:hemoglobin-like flavoprotein
LANLARDQGGNEKEVAGGPTVKLASGAALVKEFPERDRFHLDFAPLSMKEISPMTPRQIELVQNSFKLVTPILESATMMFYQRLFELDPSLRHMFHGPLEEQARKLGHVLTVVVKGLSRSEQILGAVEELGRRHANYGVRPEHYETVGTAQLWTLQTGLGEAFTAEVREAWTFAYLFLSTAMQEAAANAETVEWTAVPQPA